MRAMEDDHDYVCYDGTWTSAYAPQVLKLTLKTKIATRSLFWERKVVTNRERE
jgi:hypothetical protein